MIAKRIVRKREQPPANWPFPTFKGRPFRKLEENSNASVDNVSVRQRRIRGAPRR